jgi:hypothetical protein
VSLFAISCYSVAERIGKPFNPVLGETYEFQKGTLKFFAEQVKKRIKNDEIFFKKRKDKKKKTTY